MEQIADTKVYLMDTTELNVKSRFSSEYMAMPDTRKKKIDRYKFDSDKRLSLGAGILLNRAIAEWGLSGKVCILETEYGKPYLAPLGADATVQNLEVLSWGDKPEENSSVCFNLPHVSLSHSGTMALCVISGREVGCDIQKIDKYEENIVKRFFAKEEIDVLCKPTLEAEADLSDSTAELFYNIWARKESYVKMKGKGLSIPFDSFSVAGDSPESNPLLREVSFVKLDVPGYAAWYCLGL